MTFYIKSYRKSISILMAAVLIICIMFSGCAKHGVEYSKPPQSFAPEYELLEVGRQLGFESVDIKYYYTTLTDKQKEIYLNMYDTVENMYKGDVLLASGATSDDLTKATAAYFADNPQHFWIAETMELCWTVTDNLGIGFAKFIDAAFSWLPWIEKRTDYVSYTDAYCKMSYTYKNKKEKDEALQQIKQKMTEALSGISPQDSPFDRELYIHDWIADNCTYDDDAYEAFLESGSVGDRVNAHTVYGALVEQTATCAGYARAMQLLLSQAGIETRFIAGVRQSDEQNSAGLSHAWNIVFFNGIPYHVDLTWDDKDLWGIKDGVYTKVEGDESQYLQVSNRTEHKYFNVNEDTISKDHWGFIPQYAVSTEHSYFTYKQLDLSNPEGSFKAGLIDELTRLSETDKNFIEIYLGTNTSNYNQYVDLLFNETDGLFYDCLEEANQTTEQKYFREDLVYYGVDKSSGIVYVFTIDY